MDMMEAEKRWPAAECIYHRWTYAMMHWRKGINRMASFSILSKTACVIQGCPAGNCRISKSGNWWHTSVICRRPPAFRYHKPMALPCPWAGHITSVQRLVNLVTAAYMRVGGKRQWLTWYAIPGNIL